MTPGLYLHVPFCARICPYCDFAVTTGNLDRRRTFAADLCREVALADGEWAGIDTIYFGGGTPSCLRPETLGSILDTVRACFQVAPDVQIFLEANPEDVTRESISALRALGVGTLSLGVQSFDAEALSFLGRKHTVKNARASVELARAAGFDTVSVDLIYALPGQTLEAWRRDLEAAVALEPDHLSCYELTVHEKTPFGRRKRSGELVELSDDVQGDFFRFTHTFLRDGGFAGYEVSNFARSTEHRSRHNQKYWRHAPYLGLGPSAHSFDGKKRWWNESRLFPWTEKVRAGKRPIEDEEELGASALATEAILLGLRTYDGIDLAKLGRRFGLDLEQPNRELIEKLVAEGLVLTDGTRVRPTLDGLAVADSLAASFEIPGSPGAPRQHACKRLSSA